MIIFAREFAGVAQLVEHDLAKVGVASSSLVSRSKSKSTSKDRSAFLFLLALKLWTLKAILFT